jgi:eukaryotic-like serine/threonine-protein kinase
MRELEADPYRGMKIGRYQLLSQLTSGGMAELFLAYTAGPGGFRKYVVIKRILPDAKNNDQFVKMFLDEARVTAAFSHPNIAQVFELGQEDQDLFLAMEFISGQNLNQVTAVCARKRAVLPIGFSVAAVHDTALALHYAHTFKDPAGAPLPVIHRDVAQKNIMVTYDGIVKLLDFGIAKARGQLGRTNAGTVKGTTGYMSPEQVRGEALDGRSDVFGLGVVLFEMITGKRLFAADSELDEMKMILSAPVPRPSALVPVVPEALSDITLRALAREKADRWPSGKDLAKALSTQCAELMFDQEQRAAFMREHFEDQLQATAALLTSATDSSAKQLLVAKAVHAIRGDGGAQSGAARLSKDEVKAARAKRKKPAPESPDEVNLQLAALQGKAEALAASSTGPPTNPDAKRSLNWVVPLSLVAGLVLLAAALFKVSGALEPEPQPQTPVYDSPVPIPHAPDDPRIAAAPPTPGGESAAPPKEDKEEPKKKAVRTGQVTIVTFPEATVFRGRQQLGKTPLFNVELPLGTHMLTLVGGDGVKRALSVPVREGKNTPIKVKLEEVPVR